jgi:hypothetical protein
MLSVKHTEFAMPMKEFETTDGERPVFVEASDVSMLLSSPDSDDACIIVMKNGREVSVTGSPLLVSMELQNA